MKRPVSRSAAAIVAAGMLGVLAVAPGCLDRPVAPQQPSTTKISTQLYRASKIDKIDLLFMIDNSASMADKQQILAKAVPDLVDRLVFPRCIDAASKEVPLGTDNKCPQGSKREFEPVNDIHIGILSSSLGGHGADTCSPGPSGGYNVRQEDMSHLIQRKCVVTPENPCADFVAADTWMNKGFLFWDPLQKGPKKDGVDPGDSNVETLKSKFADLVKGTGQDGCGFEAILEAWYRFLVDPRPFNKIVPTDCGTGQPVDNGPCRGPDGNVDETVLAQRKDFLRADSLLAVVMLADENDCSVMEGGQGFLSVQAYSGMSPFHLPRGTSACAADPNSPQCTSCGAAGQEGDPECQKGGFDEKEDALNLRCYRQKQRFGIDFLYPIRRYAFGLTKPTFQPVPFCDDKEKDPRCKEWDGSAYPAGVENGEYNPVFCSEYEKDANGVENRKLCKTVIRDQKLVFLAGIVGVPWQDIAKDPKDLTKGYRPAEELGWTAADYVTYNKDKEDKDKKTPAPGVTDTVTVWDHIVGNTGYKDAENPKGDSLGRKVGGVDHINPYFLQPDPAPSGFAKDPLMIESIDPREGTNPATDTPLAATGPVDANPINGHEYNVVNRNDLQYACIFKLPQPKQCVDQDSCDCSSADKDGSNNPLCQDGTTYGTTQYRAKAYPGRRQLATLRGVEVLSPGQAIAASICPANTDNEGASDYGYRPAIATIIERLRAVLAGTCWGQELKPDGDGKVECFVFEASKMPDGKTECPPCDPTKARGEASDNAKKALSGDVNFKENNLACICEIKQAEATEPLKQCISSTDDIPFVNGQPVNGWCYVDPALNPNANQALVATCPADSKRMIRFVGNASPDSGTLTYLQCKGATFGGT